MVYPYYFNFEYFFQLAQSLGVFTMLLPFLLIFSIVYSILLRINIFQRAPAANVIVSLVVSFFALTNYYISFYMQKLFSNLAIAVLIFLVVIILFGIINIDISEGQWKWLFGGIALIASLIVIIKAFSPEFEFSLLPYLQIIIPFLIILIGVLLIVLFTSPKQGESPMIFKLINKGDKGT